MKGSQVAEAGWLLTALSGFDQTYQHGERLFFFLPLLSESGNERDDSSLLVLILTALLDRR